MTAPAIWWVRRDLRLGDNEALSEAAKGRPVIPVFIYDDVIAGQGTAARFRFHMGVKALAETLHQRGSRLVTRAGTALDVLQKLVAETGAEAVYWSRAYDPEQQERDKAVKAGLTVEAQSFQGHVLFEPWTVETGTGGPYRVYSPFWRAVCNRDVPVPLPEPALKAPDTWPDSEDISAMANGMHRAAPILARHALVGEAAAQDRLETFVAEKIDAYKADRDLLGESATSELSEPLTYGEISPRQMWHAGARARELGAKGAEHFLKEICWREFAYHLLHHYPHLLTRCWREEWEAFPWSMEETPNVRAWKEGRTGIEVVDAAMREMWVTGKMHNRARMIVASVLTKYLMADWRIGMDWFADCLTDWDPASNALGWQWVAGCGPDAAPYFRVFNPLTQTDKFDADGRYRRRWIAEGQGVPTTTAKAYFDAVPVSWGLNPHAVYPPHPIVTPHDGRARALEAYENRNF